MSKMTIKVKNKIIDKNCFITIAGPCTIDSKGQLETTARELSNIGISFLRGSPFKMRTSHTSWEGIGKEGLKYLKDAADRYNMITVAEVISTEHLEMFAGYVDILLVGTRSMQNYPLLKEIGSTSWPVILKRGMGNTVREWHEAAKYISDSNKNLLLCERGIRTFEPGTRNTLDLSAVVQSHRYVDYPVLVDPSHATGEALYVKPMSWAAAAAGAEGLIIECDSKPHLVKCDSKQTINIVQMKEIYEQLPQIVSIWGKIVI